MNDRLRKVLNYKYNAEIQDALYKIQCYSEHELVIPEHPDITAEVDKLLQKIAEAEDKMAVMELHYDQNVADKTVLQPVYMYGKKNKKKIKNYCRNNVILSLWSKSVGIYDFRVDTRVDTLS